MIIVYNSKCYYIYQVVTVLLVYSSIVQSVVHKIIERKVAGSNPAPAKKKKKERAFSLFLLLLYINK